jgi:hypothetical protein
LAGGWLGAPRYPCCLSSSSTVSARTYIIITYRNTIDVYVRRLRRHDLPKRMWLETWTVGKASPPLASLPTYYSSPRGMVEVSSGLAKRIRYLRSHEEIPQRRRRVAWHVVMRFVVLLGETRRHAVYIPSPLCTVARYCHHTLTETCHDTPSVLSVSLPDRVSSPPRLGFSKGQAGHGGLVINPSIRSRSADAHAWDAHGHPLPLSMDPAQTLAVVVNGLRYTCMGCLFVHVRGVDRNGIAAR